MYTLTWHDCINTVSKSTCREISNKQKLDQLQSQLKILPPAHCQRMDVTQKNKAPPLIMSNTCIKFQGSISNEIFN